MRIGRSGLSRRAGNGSWCRASVQHSHACKEDRLLQNMHCAWSMWNYGKMEGMGYGFMALELGVISRDHILFT